VQKWVWLHINNKHLNEIDLILKKLQSCNFTGIHAAGEMENILKLAEKAADFDLKVNYWYWTLINTDIEIQKNHPEWFNISRENISSLTKPPYVDYYKWLCPNKSEVQNYIFEEIERICVDPRISGIHLDYIRFPDVILPVGIQSHYNLVQNTEEPQFDFCYCKDCREKFKFETGKDPLELLDPAADIEWLNFRLESVNGLVRLISDIVHARNKELSAAVFPSPKLAVKLVRQDWLKWDLDAVFPMIYYKFYNKEVDWISEILYELNTEYHYQIPVIPGIYLPEMKPEELEKALQLTRDLNCTGLSFFDYTSLSNNKWFNI